MQDDYKEVRIGPNILEIPEEWEKNQLKKICNINMGSSPKSKYYNEEKKGLPFFQGNAEFGTMHPDVKLWCSEPQKVANKDDILISVRAPVGELNIATEKCCIGRGLASLNGKKATNRYIYYLLKQFKPTLKMYSQGSTFESINKKTLELFDIPLPPLPEQKKIATILSTVDKALEKTTHIIDKTKRLKKGLMQRLLTKGIGHEEFKEVKIGPKTIQIPKQWDLNSIDSLSKEFISGGTPSTKNEDYWKGNIHWITGANIRDIKVNKGKDYITEKGLNNSNTKIVPANNIIIATRTTVGNIGINLIDIAISQDVTGIILNKQIVDVNFFVWSMQNLRYLLQVYQQGSTIKGITRNVLKRFQIPLPPLPEQKQIASILTSVDNKIQKEQEYKERLQQLKKGLMQQLLTGKKRVQV